MKKAKGMEQIDAAMTTEQKFFLVTQCWKDPAKALAQGMSFGRAMQLLLAVEQNTKSSALRTRAVKLREDIVFNSASVAKVEAAKCK